MRKIGPRFVAILIAMIIVCFGLGKFFDSRCEGGCLKDTFADSEKWKNNNFNFSYNSDDDNDDKNIGSGSGHGQAGPAGDEAPQLPPLDDIDTIIVQSVSTDWLVNVTEGKPDLILSGALRKNRWTVVKNGKTLTIGLKSRAAKNAVLKIPKNYNGDLRIHTVSGEIELMGAIALKKLLLESASGNIDFSSWPSEALTLNTISGDVRSVQGAHNVVPKILSLNSVSGDIRIEISKNFEELRAKTVSGELKLRTAKNTSFRYDLSTVSGSFHGLPSNGAQDNGIVNKHYSGTFGKPASAQLYFESVSGDFELEQVDIVGNR